MRLLTLLLFLLPSYAFATMKIAIIDSGIKREEIKAKFCSESKDIMPGRDEYDQEHGTIVAKALSEGLENFDYCIMDIRVFNDNVGNNYDVSNAIMYAAKNGARIINLSLSGSGYSFYERQAIKTATDNHATLFIASGNESQNLDIKCNSYPACYDLDRVIVVGDTCTSVANKGSIVDISTCSKTEYKGSYHYGTSFSAPKIINLILKTIKESR